MTSTAIRTTLDPSGLAVHLPALQRLATRLCRSPEAGDDLVQDTFERALRSPRRIRGDTRPYLMQALRNTHIDRIRAARNRPKTVELDPDAAGCCSSTDEQMRAHCVLDAVAALPCAYRDVVLAVDAQGCSYREAADRQGIPIGTVMSRLSRGRRQVIRAVDGVDRST